MPLDLYTAHVWKTCLVHSLEMTYLSPSTRRPLPRNEMTFGAPCVAHPQFSPHVIAAMDASLPKKEADAIYKLAFLASKPTADAMLQKFDKKQAAGQATIAMLCISIWLAVGLTHRRVRTTPSLFHNALTRFARFAPRDAVHLLLQKRKCDG